MSVAHRTGDLFAQPDLDALAHGVNCLGAMGAGIAVLFKRRWPAMYEEYAAACRTGNLAVGGHLPWRAPDGLWVYNLASQHRTGADARLEAIEPSLRLAVAHAEENFVDSIGLPRIGSDIGGLTWADVLAVIETVGATTAVRLVVVSLPGAPA